MSSGVNQSVYPPSAATPIRDLAHDISRFAKKLQRAGIVDHKLLLAGPIDAKDETKHSDAQQKVVPSISNETLAKGKSSKGRACGYRPCERTVEPLFLLELTTRLKICKDVDEWLDDSSGRLIAYRGARASATSGMFPMKHPATLLI